MCAKSFESCPTLCEPMDCSLPGSSVHGILQARIFKWAAMPYFSGSCQLSIKPTSFTTPELAGGFFTTSWASLVAQRLKCLPTMQETWVQSLGQEDPLEKEMEPIPVFLPGESHGRRSLVGYSPRGRKESDTTERLNHHHKAFPQNLLWMLNL